MPPGAFFGFETSLVGLPFNGDAAKTLFTWTWESTYSQTTKSGAVTTQTASSRPVDGSGTGGVTITSINGVTQTPPTVSCTAPADILRPSDGKPATVTVSGTITPGTSSLVSSTYEVVDEYGKVRSTGTIAITSGNYSFKAPLTPAGDRGWGRRDDDVWPMGHGEWNGDDKDGRKYTIYETSSDSVGNTGSCLASVKVSHDHRH